MFGTLILVLKVTLGISPSAGFHSISTYNLYKIQSPIKVAINYDRLQYYEFDSKDSMLYLDKYAYILKIGVATLFTDITKFN